MLKANLDKDLELIFTGNGYLFSYFRKVSKTDDTIYITIHVPKRDHRLFGHALCPEYERRDMTIPIHYGYHNWRKRE